MFGLSCGICGKQDNPDDSPGARVIRLRCGHLAHITCLKERNGDRSLSLSCGQCCLPLFPAWTRSSNNASNSNTNNVIVCGVNGSGNVTASNAVPVDDIFLVGTAGKSKTYSATSRKVDDDVLSTIVKSKLRLRETSTPSTRPTSNSQPNNRNSNGFSSTAPISLSVGTRRLSSELPTSPSPRNKVARRPRVAKQRLATRLTTKPVVTRSRVSDARDVAVPDLDGLVMGVSLRGAVRP